MDGNTLTVLVSGLCTLLGSFFGTLASIQVIKYRLQQLEKQVEKHNSVIDRTYKLEKNYEVLSTKLCGVHEIVDMHAKILEERSLKNGT